MSAHLWQRLRQHLLRDGQQACAFQDAGSFQPKRSNRPLEGIHQHLEGVRRSVLADEVATAVTRKMTGCGAMTHSPSVAFLRALICCSQVVRRLENAVDSSNTAGWQGLT